VSAFGPPRDGFGFFPRLLDGSEEGAGERLEGKDISADNLDRNTRARWIWP